MNAVTHGTNRTDNNAIREALDLLLAPDAVTELRVLNTDRGTASGYYDAAGREALVREAARWSGRAPGVYVIPNPVHPDLLARAVNRVRLHAKEGDGTGDAHIVRRIWLYIDIDPRRPAGISSTDAQHALALARAREIRDWLIALGFPADAIVIADSGNGAHVLVRIDLPNDPASLALVNGCLAALAFRFEDDGLVIDQKVGNAARIWKLYGTLAAKGDSTPERPHRRASILKAPEHLSPAPREALERLAALAPAKPPPRTTKPTLGAGPHGDPDLTRWIAEYKPPVVRTGPWNGGTKWILNPCPWNEAHTNGSAYIVQGAEGWIAAGCHHDGCRGNDWHALRAMYEPERRERRVAAGGGVRTVTPEVVASRDNEDGALEPRIVVVTTEEAAEVFPDESFVPALAGKRLTAEARILLGYDRRLWRYINGVYRADGDDWIRLRTRELVGDRFRRNHLEEVAAYLRAQLVTLGHEPPPEYINCANGLLDWKTGTLHPHSPDVLSMNQVPVIWNPAATAPTFTGYLESAIPADAMDFAEEIVGYALYARNPFRKAVLLYGPGGNGKSTLLRLITALLGAENVSSVALQTLGENRFAAADLFGKLANICGDLDARAIQHTDLFKQMTGGDPIQAERKFRDTFRFVSHALPIFSANEFPRTADQTDAWFERWIIVPMPRKFEGTSDDDTEMSNKLAAELEGVLVRGVTGLRRLMARRRFELPASVKRMMGRYRQTLDTVRAFVTEECHFDPDDWIDRAQLYRHYRAWCQDGGRLALANTTFNAHLLQAYGQGEGAQIRRLKRVGRPGWLGLAVGPGTTGDGEDWEDTGDVGDGSAYSSYRSVQPQKGVREGVGKMGNGVPSVPSAPEAPTTAPLPLGANGKDPRRPPRCSHPDCGRDDLTPASRPTDGWRCRVGHLTPPVEVEL